MDKKESFWESQRTRVFISGLILEVLLFGSAWIAHAWGIEIRESQVNVLAGSIAVLVLGWIKARTDRNMST